VSAQARGRRPAADRIRAAQPIVAAAIDKLRDRGLSDEEIRRLFEAQLAGLEGLSKAGGQRG